MKQQPGQLSSHEWDALHEWANRFEQAWRDNPPARLEDHIPGPEHPLRRHILLELIKIDLEFRWKGDQATLAESYQKRYPELSSEADAMTSIVFEEYRVRQMFGDRAPLSEYRRRFPDFFDDLEKLVQERGGDLSATRDSKHFTSTHDNAGTLLPPKQPLRKDASKPAQPAPASPDQAGPKPGQAPMHLPGGDLKLIKFLGRGQFGEVWRAEAPGGVEVAVKIILRAMDQDESQRELDSLELIKNLQHPFLVKTHAFHRFDDRFYIVMELAAQSLGGRLKECLKDTGEPISPEELVPYMRESAEALDFLHDQGVLHRDIKPDNIMLVHPPKQSLSLGKRDSGNTPRPKDTFQRDASKRDTVSRTRPHVKVADFGLARVLNSQIQTASIAGAPAFMAPEVWRGKVTAHTDQYALAVTYVQLRLNRLPFRGSNIAHLMTEHLEQAPDLEGLEANEAKAVARALSKDPEKRFPTCFDFAVALEQALNPPMAPAQPPRKSLGFKAMAGMVLGALLIGLAVWWLPRLMQGSDFTVLPTEPIKLKAGEKRRVLVQLQRRHFTDPIQISIEDLPGHVEATTAEVPGDQSSARLEVTSHFRANIGLESVQRTLRLKAHSGAMTHEVALPLTIDPAAVMLPFGLTLDIPDSAEVVRDKLGTGYLDRFDVVKGEHKIRFVLVPRLETDVKELGSFYMMEQMVTVGLFRQFARANPDAVIDMPWDMPGLAGKDYPRDDLPVFGVGVEAADKFARWIDPKLGRLPQADQWDKASGFYLPKKGEGPFIGSKASLQPGDIGINRAKQGPIPCGAATKDISPLGICDMAGNGREWTRNLAGENQLVPIANPTVSDFVLLRGKSWKAREPLTYREMETWEQSTPPVMGYAKNEVDVGFRIVLQP